VVQASPIGITIDNHYKILSAIGSGGVGEVYLANHLGLNRQVAVKFLQPQLATDNEWRARFLREGRICTTLQNPNIARCYAAGLWHGRVPYLVFEYIQGKTLRSIIASEHKLDWRRAVSICYKVCDGLREAHAIGVVHRDLKPENIMICDGVDADEVKIIDFGLAGITPTSGSRQKLTAAGDLIGTVNYMSPEQCRGERVDGRSDIYSLGCVLYESITGEPPFHADEAMVVMLRHEHDVHRNIDLSDKKTSRRMEAVLGAALAKDRESRYQSIEDLQQDLDSVLRGEDPSGATLIWSNQKNKTKNRRTVSPQVASASIVALLLAILIGCFQLLLCGNPIVVSSTSDLLKSFGQSGAPLLFRLSNYYDEKHLWSAESATLSAYLQVAKEGTSDENRFRAISMLSKTAIAEGKVWEGRELALQALKLLLQRLQQTSNASLAPFVVRDYQIVSENSARLKNAEVNELAKLHALPLFDSEPSARADIIVSRLQILASLKELTFLVALASASVQRFLTEKKPAEAGKVVNQARILIASQVTPIPPSLEVPLLALESDLYYFVGDKSSGRGKFDRLISIVLDDNNNLSDSIRAAYYIDAIAYAAVRDRSAIANPIARGEAWLVKRGGIDKYMAAAVGSAKVIWLGTSEDTEACDKLSLQILDSLRSLPAGNPRSQMATLVGLCTLYPRGPRLKRINEPHILRALERCSELGIDLSSTASLLRQQQQSYLNLPGSAPALSGKSR